MGTVPVSDVGFFVPTATSPVRKAVRAAADAGVVLVCPASSGRVDAPPARFLRRRAIVVGATDDDDVAAAWSRAARRVDVFAPGVALQGALGGVADPDSYGRWSGVEFAAAFVSAVAAMLLARDHDAGVRGVRARLVATARAAYGGDGRPARAGRADLARAVSRD